MSAKLRCLIFTGCVASVGLESVWTAIDCAGTSPGRVSLATGLSWPRGFIFVSPKEKFLSV